MSYVLVGLEGNCETLYQNRRGLYLTSRPVSVRSPVAQPPKLTVPNQMQPALATKGTGFMTSTRLTSQGREAARRMLSVIEPDLVGHPRRQRRFLLNPQRAACTYHRVILEYSLPRRRLEHMQRLARAP